MTNPVDPTNQTDQPKPFVTREAKIRFSLSLQCGSVLYACCAGYGGYFAYAAPRHLPNAFPVLLGTPAVAAIAFVALLEIFPSLIAPRRLVFPLMVTLPLVFNSLLFLICALLTSNDNSLIAPYEQLRLATFWESPKVLGLLMISQVACLSALATLKGGPVE